MVRAARPGYPGDQGGACSCGGGIGDGGGQIGGGGRVGSGWMTEREGYDIRTRDFLSDFWRVGDIN